MVSYGTTSYESFYGGGASSLSPDYGNFTGYRMSASQLGFCGSSQTANQIGEAVSAIKQGVKTFEVTLASPDITEAIPKQHFKEMRALMKLSGVKPSVHGPIIDAAGFGERGWEGDLARKDNERRMFDAIEKAQILDPKGNIPVVLHSTAGVPGKEFRPGKGEERFEVEKAIAINLETKQMVPLEREYKYRPGDPKSLKSRGELFTPEEQLISINESEWENKLTDLATFNKHADDIIGNAPMYLKNYEQAAIIDKEGTIKDLKTNEKLPNFKDNPKAEMAYNQMHKADIFLENIRLNFATAFHKAYKFGSEKQQKELRKLSEDYSAVTEELREVPLIFNPIKKKKILENSIHRLQQITSGQPLIKDGKMVLDKTGHGIPDKRFGAPKVYQEVEEFAMDKAAKTFGNLAMKSYDKFKKNAPVIAIENLYQGMAFSKAEDLKKLVEKSRDNFVEQLMEDKGLNRNTAEKIAEKQLGVTWDVGHLNIMKKKGFEKKDIIAETKKIAPMVKHVHLTDNFGFSDSHLAPGMGNVPFKEILMELEKTGRLDEMRKIVEAPGFVQHFKKSPHSITLGAFGSPIYGMKAGPYWNQAMDTMGSYFGGYGTINPEQHNSMYGAGFTGMPVELGGQMPGTQSRFGGAPMA